MDVGEASGTQASAEEVGLIDSLRAGEAAAYEKLVRDQAGRMLAVTRRILRNEEDAQDAVQEAFLQAFRSLERFEGKSRLSTWLHRIAVNAALMKLRSKRRKPEESIEDLLPRYREDGHHEVEPKAWLENADEAMERHETRELVRQKIDELPETYRNVLILRDIEGMDTEETARELGISKNAAKLRLHRARIALRGLLDPVMRGESR